MDVEQPTSSTSTTTISGPAPFLLKTYDMIDDSTTDDIVSWSSSKTSFVVWNPPEFARLLLPTYFKHNNFSSFIRQLNTYGFRKIDPERWEFANEDFSKDNKHLLKNIHRRKPIHSHSQQPPQQGPSSFGDAERAALEEEIERIASEKAALQSNLSRVRHQQQCANLQLETLEQRVFDMEQRQLRMITFVAKAVNSPCFVEHLVRLAGASMDFAAITKKRRLPKLDFCQEVVENNSSDNQILHGPSIAGTSKPEFGATFHKDFSNKLELELSPAASDSLVSAGGQSSNEDAGSSQRKPSEGAIGDARTRPEGFSFAIDTLELLDTGASFALKKNGSSYRNVTTVVSPELHGSQHYSTCEDEVDGHLSCHLNLTLFSSPMQVKSSDCLLDSSTELRSGAGGNGGDFRITAKGRNSAEGANISSQLVSSTNQASDPAAGRVNDVFWEQFLTERPGSSDTEEAISSFRGNPYDEQEEGKHGVSKSWNNEQNMEQLTL